MTMLTMRDVHAYYGSSYVLQGVSLRVRTGEVVGLLGRNGMGKTTTLKSVMGLVRVRSGEIRLEQTSVHLMPAHRIARLGISYIPQERRVFPELTVLENLRLGVDPRGREKRILQSLASSFPILQERLQQRAGTLSGGEQQLLAIARAILAQPRYVLMDEPTEGLMPSLVQVLEERIKILKQQELGILLSEQNADTALRVCDRFYILEKGRVSAECDAHDISLEELQKYLGVEA
jgi:branched-chain amino acid transport system ATP-binding protein